MAGLVEHMPLTIEERYWGETDCKIKLAQALEKKTE